MKPSNKNPSEDSLSKVWSLIMNLIYFILVMVILALGYLILEDHIHDYLNPKTYTQVELKQLEKRANAKGVEENFDNVVNGIHVRTGFYDDPNLQTVIATCTSCHSAKLVTQNKATREGWQGMIKWMQATQGLPDLGKNEPIVLDYLAKYYAPENTGRRMNLDIDAIEWYVLNLK